MRLEAHQPPEVTESETTDLLLEIALWGSQWDQLRWLDKPGDGSMAQARAILRWLGALDDEARLTSLGRRIAGQGTQARLAAMIEKVDDRALVADITGLLERGVRSRSDRLSAQFDKRRNPAQSFWRKRLGVGRDTPPDASRCGQALTYAYPDRIARQREGSSRYLMANGKGARLHPQSDLTGTPWLVIADAKYEAGDVVIRCAEPLSESEVRRRTKGLLEQVPVCAWDPDTDGVVACRQTRFGAIVVQESVVSRLPKRLSACSKSRFNSGEYLSAAMFSLCVGGWTLPGPWIPAYRTSHHSGLQTISVNGSSPISPARSAGVRWKR